MKESGDKTCCATKSQFAEHWEGEGLRGVSLDAAMIWKRFGQDFIFVL